MQLEIVNLYTWHHQDDGGKELVATFVTTAELPDPRVRAHEVMRRLTGEGKHDSMTIEEVFINPSDQELGLKPKLADVAQIDFVKSAAMQLMHEGEMAVPLWINVAWLRHEIRANYDVYINCNGRKLTIVSKADEVRAGVPLVQTEPDDGFAETP